MLQNLMDKTQADIRVLLETLLQTKKEIDKLPYYTRKKVRKFLESHLQMDLEELTSLLLEILPLLHKLNQRVQDKRFDGLDRTLQTLRYWYIEKMNVLVQLSSFYQNLCNPLERYLTKKESLQSTLDLYKNRQELTDCVFTELHAIFDLLYVEEI